MLVSHTGSSWVYRYWTTGAYTSGSVAITFLPGGYGFTDGSTSTFTGPVNPVSFTVDGVATPNIHYLDVTLTPTSGDTLDVASVTDTSPEFALSGAGAAGVQLVTDAAPTQLPGTSTFRYYVSGSFGPGTVTLAFAAGSFTSSNAANPSGYGNLASSASFLVQQPTAALADPQTGSLGSLQTLNGRSYVDVSFSLPAAEDALTVSSVTTSSFSISAHDSSAGTIAFDTTQAPIDLGVSGGVYTFRFFTTGTLRSGAVDVATTGGVSYVDGSGQTQTTTTLTPTAVFTGDVYVDVAFTGAGGAGLDAATITGNELQLTGAGAGTVAVDAAVAPTILAGGTVRYYLTGQFAAGTVHVAFAAGSWADTAGNPGAAGSATFKLVDQLPASAASSSSSTDGRVFFIAISGGVDLNAAGLFDTGGKPLLSIHGGIELDIGSKTLPDGSTQARFLLTANGTVYVYKIGNIASGAATFVLQVGGSTGIQFWGVAAIQTNFDFLQQYGIYLSGTALLQINMTGSDHTETLTLAGHPGRHDLRRRRLELHVAARGAADRHVQPGRPLLELDDALLEPGHRPQPRRHRRQHPDGAADDAAELGPVADVRELRRHDAPERAGRGRRLRQGVEGPERRRPPVLHPGADRREREPDLRRRRRAADVRPAGALVRARGRRRPHHLRPDDAARDRPGRPNGCTWTAASCSRSPPPRRRSS